MTHPIEPDPGLRQAIADGLGRISRPVLDAPKALFFRGSDDLSITHEACGCIAVVGVEAEDVHRGIALLKGSDRLRQCSLRRALDSGSKARGERLQQTSALVVSGREAPVKSG